MNAMATCTGQCEVLLRDYSLVRNATGTEGLLRKNSPLDFWIATCLVLPCWRGHAGCEAPAPALDRLRILAAGVDRDARMVMRLLPRGDSVLGTMSDRFKTDEEMCLLLLRKGIAVTWLPPALLRSRAFALLAAPYEQYFRAASPELRDDEAIARLACSCTSYDALHYASMRVRGLPEIVAHAARARPDSLHWASKALRRDRAFLLELAKEGRPRLVACVAKYCLAPLRADADFNAELLACQPSPVVLQAMARKFLESEAFMVKAVAANWRLLAKAQGAAACSVAVATAAAQASPEATALMPEALRAPVEAALPRAAPKRTTAALRLSLGQLLSNPGEDLDVLRQVTCPVCYDLLAHENSARQCPNGHVLCRECLEQVAGKRRRIAAAKPAGEGLACPTCRVVFPKSAYGRNMLVEQMAGVLRVPCPLGCGEQLCGAALDQHVASVCRLRTVQCFAGCCALPPAELAEHVRTAHGPLQPEFGLTVPGPSPPRWAQVEGCAVFYSSRVDCKPVAGTSVQQARVALHVMSPPEHPLELLLQGKDGDGNLAWFKQYGLLGTVSEVLFCVPASFVLELVHLGLRPRAAASAAECPGSEQPA